VARRAGGRATACLERSVAPALELSQVLPPGRYCPHNHPPLEPVGGSEVAPPDWSV
jgi:hypothetical protein